MRESLILIGVAVVGSLMFLQVKERLQTASDTMLARVGQAECMVWSSDCLQHVQANRNQQEVWLTDIPTISIQIGG